MQISPENIVNNEEAVWELFRSVGFGNSRFQDAQFAVNKAMPARTYRQVALELYNKAKALHENGVIRDKMKARLLIKEDLRRWLIRFQWLPFVRHYLAIVHADIRGIEFAMKDQDMLVEDAMDSVRHFLAILKSLPEYDREKFEAEEKEYWPKQLMMKARNEMLERRFGISEGTTTALEQMGNQPEAVMLLAEQSIEQNIKRLSEPKQ